VRDFRVFGFSGWRGVWGYIRSLRWRRFWFCLTAERSAFGGLLEKTPSNQVSGSWLGPTSSGTRTPTTLRGPAAIRHPWRGAALAASMPLDPLHAVCVWPAPKSRFVVSGLSRTRAILAGANALRVLSRASISLAPTEFAQPTLLICFSDAMAQTLSIATWVQAKRRRRAVSRHQTLMF
jgi:hypothetical protein